MARLPSEVHDASRRRAQDARGNAEALLANQLQENGLVLRRTDALKTARSMLADTDLSTLHSFSLERRIVEPRN
jgi:hypothetical protein